MSDISPLLIMQIKTKLDLLDKLLVDNHQLLYDLLSKIKLLSTKNKKMRELKKELETLIRELDVASINPNNPDIENQLPISTLQQQNINEHELIYGGYFYL